MKINLSIYPAILESLVLSIRETKKAIHLAYGEWLLE